MSTQLMTSLLAKGNTGADMLKILEALTDGPMTNTQEPIEGVSMAAQYGTLEDIEFWWVDNIGG